MDLQMPKMDGVDAMIAIRNEFPEARIIVLTTYTGDVQILLSRCTQIGSSALSVQGGEGKLDEFDTLKLWADMLIF
jgi:CheY-like chemotaxis protein